jgi:hypothetical protein
VNPRTSEEMPARVEDIIECIEHQMQSDWRNAMPLISLIVTLVVVGVILWLINNYLPIDGTIKKILNVVVVIVVILWLLTVFGVLGPLSSVRIG